MKTWIDNESKAYPSGSVYAGRRAYVELRANPHNPVLLPYGQRRKVRVGIADTVFTIPARLKHGARTVRGFVSIDTNSDTPIYTFTPEADPAQCRGCAPGEGCKR